MSGRSSFCSPNIKLGEFLCNIGAKIVAIDMPPLMQNHTVSCARKAYVSQDKFISKALASTLKKELDEGIWTGVALYRGTSFGSFVTLCLRVFVLLNGSKVA
ncbi:hypothetical protein HHK36_009511 [Tetracentron sinense]|uniref:Dynein light chain n=1 Tax=Tetracentron sinense TaxID=13715 RepID=A0A835DIB3_TETSI|nr:hypothetical protein HHK36_009511 [Tetracentron sinense]